MRTRTVIAVVAGAALLVGLAAMRSAVGLPPPIDPSASPSMAPASVYPSPVVSGPGAQAVDCSAIPRYGTGVLPADAGGEFIPYGANAITRCDTPMTTPAPTVAPPEVLTEGVDSFVRLLNSLPAPQPDQACLRVAFPTQLSYVITFEPATRKRPLVMVVDRNCAALVITDNLSSRVRSYAQLDPMPLFEQLFAAQGPGQRSGSRATTR
ncbi:hypothetical protein ACQP1P_31685 [Dactylosporangium sp. CA-052675]|uniref:hypothetical protein n=1 Tax=Dactylosporangium sp. CA-052675 TaxID=3239927 RepID=UPI003D94655D